MSTSRISVYHDDTDRQRPFSIEEMSSPFDAHSVEMTRDEAIAVVKALNGFIDGAGLTVDAVVDFLNKADRETIQQIRRGLNPRLAFGER